MTIYNAYLIKGYLIDKKAPKRIMEALDTLIGGLHATDEKPKKPDPMAPAHEAGIENSEEEESESLPESSCEAGAEAVKPTPPAIESPPPNVKTIETAAEPEPAPQRKRREWSPEQRAAAADRMRATQARKHGKDTSPETPAASSAEPAAEAIHKAIRQDPVSPSKPKQSPTIDHERLITVHSGYAGKREDGQLTDSDWPDIKSRLSKGSTKAAIASDYDVGVEDLDFFISSNQRREAKHPPGEARAPFPSLTGGAS